ncbi:hypothetical protein [Paenibacillus oenotherae]|uniref:hypothetical protein n=1 Tax=Paenibacillus oenotherae TaxID=1435645 RepID=UPI003CCE6E54
MSLVRVSAVLGIKLGDELVAFDVQVRQQTIHPLRQPSGLVAKDGYDGWNKRHTDDERIDQHADRQSETDLLDHAVVREYESGEYSHHNDSGGNYDTAGLVVSMNNALRLSV